MEWFDLIIPALIAIVGAGVMTGVMTVAIPGTRPLRQIAASFLLYTAGFCVLAAGAAQGTVRSAQGIVVLIAFGLIKGRRSVG